MAQSKKPLAAYLAGRPYAVGYQMHIPLELPDGTKIVWGMYLSNVPSALRAIALEHGRAKEATQMPPEAVEAAWLDSPERDTNSPVDETA